ncbi:CRISPR-associated endonuclease Cas3'', partial [Corynebacterium heidelbergense]
MDFGSAWAKTAPDGSFGMSVAQHALDTMGAMEIVAHRFLGETEFAEIRTKSGIEPHAFLQFIAAVHDCGKLSPHFQQKSPDLCEPLKAKGYTGKTSRDQRQQNHHSGIGALSLREWLQNQTPPTDKMTRSARRAWYALIAGHHGAFPTPADSLGNGLANRMYAEPANWAHARLQFLDWVADQAGLTADDRKQLPRIKWDAPSLATTTGLLIAADWLASNPSNFPYTGRGIVDDQPARLKDAQRKITLGGRWHPGPVTPETFAARFGLPPSAKPRPLQRLALELAQQTADADVQGGLFIIEEQTGGGKTEAALAMADIIGRAQGSYGLLYAQPTRVTSDAAFTRVADWARRSQSNPDAQPVSTVLAHGKSSHNEEYQGIFGSGHPRQIFDETSPTSQNPHTALEATEWFRGPKTHLLASIVVGTIDQLLFTVLRSKHLVLRHLGLHGKVVVIDEVHAADPYMRVYLTRALEWLGAYRIPVIALSATLPSPQRNELIHAYHRGRYGSLATGDVSDDLAVPLSPGYPRITAYLPPPRTPADLEASQGAQPTSSTQA